MRLVRECVLSRSEQAFRTQAVMRALAQWHKVIYLYCPVLLHQEVTFRALVVHTPYSGAPVIALILTTVAQMFTEFIYVNWPLRMG